MKADVFNKEFLKFIKGLKIKSNNLLKEHRLEKIWTQLRHINEVYESYSADMLEVIIKRMANDLLTLYYEIMKDFIGEDIEENEFLEITKSKMLNIMNIKSDYGLNQDRLFNFRIAKEKFWKNMGQICIGYMLKHIVSIEKIVKYPEELKHKDNAIFIISEKFIDSLNYCGILIILCKEELNSCVGRELILNKSKEVQYV